MEQKIEKLIGDFCAHVGTGEIDIYNEFSLQHELGMFLRTRLSGCKIEFERNVAHFKLIKSEFEKKEIDITIISPLDEMLCAIELKYPRNGQIPESMFGFCKDIAFLEQLVVSGFKSGFFLAFVDEKLFYSGDATGIYAMFRGSAPITGSVIKPTGAKDATVKIVGAYRASWNSVVSTTKYCLIRVDRPENTI